MFQIASATYYQTTSEVLGKLYSNTMMMNLLNSRMGYNRDITNDSTMSNELTTDHRTPVVFSTSQGGISVTRTREEWTDEESSSHGQGAKGLMFTGKHPLDSDTNASFVNAIQVDPALPAVPSQHVSNT